MIEELMNRPVWILYTSMAVAVLSSGEAVLKDGSTCGIPAQINDKDQRPVAQIGVTAEIVKWDDVGILIHFLGPDSRTETYTWLRHEAYASITAIPHHVDFQTGAGAKRSNLIV